jgi:N-terminal half of MaoC dehydratase
VPVPLIPEELPMTIMPIERGKIREYATATGAARPAYLDDPKAVVPPTFLATVVFWMPVGETLRSPEVLRACAAAGVPADLGRLLSLEQEYVYHGPPPRAGETLRTAERLGGTEVKRTRDGRAMVVIRFTVDFRDERGGLRAECNYTSAYVQPPLEAVRRP